MMHQLTQTNIHGKITKTQILNGFHQYGKIPRLHH